MWFSSGSVFVGRGVWWFVGRLSFEICPDAFMLPVLLIQIWIISGQWLNLVSFLFFSIWNADVTLLQTNESLIWKNTLLAYTDFFIYIYTACFYNISYSFLFCFFIAHFHTVYIHTHKNTFSLSEADNQSGSPLGFLQTFDRFYTTRILRQLCGCVNLSLLMTFSVFALLEAVYA